ncbi:MAG: sugar ABC transporter permease [Anaerolineae bacterium]|nr:sugar ABC transporter permease [Anaerolineae bacterium]MDW8102049.1 sugar ABC transporter permease [Anaerolineae bacterium]
MVADALRGLHVGVKWRKVSPMARWEATWGFVFLSPWLFGFMVFYLIPMGASLVFSFTNFQLAHPELTRFIGLENYQELFRDPIVRKSMWITIRFMLFSVPISLIVPLALATLLNAKNLWARRVFTTLFYMPTIVPLISAIYIWQGFLNPRTGWLNKFLFLFGIEGPDWLNSVVWVYPALIMIGFWGIGNAMLTMLAGMRNVPAELYDAARVDGAGFLAIFWNITLPMITPVIFYNLVLSVIGHFQYFIIPWVLQGPTGDPGGATMFFNLYLFKEAFVYMDMGYGATLAWVLFFIALVTTIFLFSTAKYWVYYTAGD